MESAQKIAESDKTPEEKQRDYERLATSGA